MWHRSVATVGVFVFSVLGLSGCGGPGGIEGREPAGGLDPTGAGGVGSLDGETGRLWTVEPGWMLAAGRGGMVGISDRFVVRWQAETGEVLWRVAAPGHDGICELLDDGKLICSVREDGGSRKLCRMRLADGDVMWCTDVNFSCFDGGYEIVSGDYLACWGDGRHGLLIVDTRDGTTREMGAGLSMLGTDGHRIAFGDPNGLATVLWVDPRDGTIAREQFDERYSRPAVISRGPCVSVLLAPPDDSMLRGRSVVRCEGLQEVQVDGYFVGWGRAGADVVGFGQIPESAPAGMFGMVELRLLRLDGSGRAVAQGPWVGGRNPHSGVSTGGCIHRWSDWLQCWCSGDPGASSVWDWGDADTIAVQVAPTLEEPDGRLEVWRTERCSPIDDLLRAR